MVKISLIVVMIVSFHQLVDYAIGPLMALCSQVQIDHGCVQAAMSEVLLDASNVDSGFQ